MLTRVVLAALAVGAANLVVSLIGINYFVGRLLQKPWDHRYFLLFTIFLLMSFIFPGRTMRLRMLRRLWAVILYGAGVGWVCGLLALLCAPVIVGEWRRISNTITMPGGIVGLLWVPTVTMGWFVGGLAGYVWWFLAKRQANAA